MCRTPFIGPTTGNHETPRVDSSTEQQIVRADDEAYNAAFERLTAAFRQSRSHEQSDSPQVDEHDRDGNEYGGMYS